MKTKLFIFIKYILIVSIICVHINSNAFAENLCQARGYTFGFFNGVWTSHISAIVKALFLGDYANVGMKFNDEPVQFEAFYNHTGSEVGATGAQDIAEVFEQRAAEIDSSGELKKRWEYFFENIAGEKTLTNKLLTLFPTATDLFSQLYTDFISKAIAGWAYLLSNPPTEADYLKNNTRLDALAAQRQKLMLVAHSQGNFFVNHAYEHIVSKVGASSVKVVHIAPASYTLYGDYRLADIDLIINGLRIQGLNSVRENNLTLPVSVADPSGHMLLETYLDPSRRGRQEISELILKAMQQLTTPATGGNVGAFTVTLTWDGTGDVDLHVSEPNGAHVYYEQKVGIVGYLDLDNVIGFGAGYDQPEHYCSSCDSTILQPGVYSVGINNFYNATGRTATVQVSSSKGGVIATKTLSVGAERGSAGNQSPIHVLNVTVSKDAKTGQFTYTAN